jgi:hypothetical protein
MSDDTRRDKKTMDAEEDKEDVKEDKATEVNKQ